MKYSKNFFATILLGLGLFLIAPQIVSAAPISVTGFGSVSNTSSKLDFTNYSSNVKIESTAGSTGGDFSGYGFLEDLGWVAFGKVDNPGGTEHVQMNLSSGVVTGKAYVMNTGAYIDFNASPYFSNVIINVATGSVTGYGWSEDVGWINFANMVAGSGFGSLATNAPATVVITASDWSTDLEVVPVVGSAVTVGVKAATDNARIAEFTANFSTPVNFTGVTADASGNIAFFHAPSLISTLTNGAASSYTLYVVKAGGDSVWICPGASALNQVTLSCSGGYFMSEANPIHGAVTVAVSGGYWVISGLTGTGAMSVLIGAVQDTMTRLAVSTASNHEITFGTNFGVGLGQNFTVEFDATAHNFNFGSVAVSDVSLSDATPTTYAIQASADATHWGLAIANDTLTFSAPTGATGFIPGASQVIIKIGTNVSGGVNQITNPGTVGTYRLLITVNNAVGEQGAIAIPIVDSDQVNVTSYINTFISFDIDTVTASGTQQCISSGAGACLAYEGGAAASNYTVDLGELNSTYVNKSDTVNVQHANGDSAKINSIYLDLTSNAYDGVVVYVKSANGGLQGPGTNLISSTTLTENSDIVANSGVYGFSVPSTLYSKANGTIVPPTNCNATAKYCRISTAGTTQVFNTFSKPLDTGRVRMDLAAAASYVNNPGPYTDTLTFTAVATF